MSAFGQQKEEPWDYNRGWGEKKSDFDNVGKKDLEMKTSQLSTSSLSQPKGAYWGKVREKREEKNTKSTTSGTGYGKMTGFGTGSTTSLRTGTTFGKGPSFGTGTGSSFSTGSSFGTKPSFGVGSSTGTGSLFGSGSTTQGVSKQSYGSGTSGYMGFGSAKVPEENNLVVYTIGHTFNKVTNIIDDVELTFNSISANEKYIHLSPIMLRYYDYVKGGGIKCEYFNPVGGYGKIGAGTSAFSGFGSGTGIGTQQQAGKPDVHGTKAEKEIKYISPWLFTSLSFNLNKPDLGGDSKVQQNVAETTHVTITTPVINPSNRGTFYKNKSLYKTMEDYVDVSNTPDYYNI